MSCFIMEHDPLCKLSTWIASLLDWGWNFHRITPPNELVSVFSDCMNRNGYGHNPALIYRRLYFLNASAYSGRYKESVSAEPFMPFHNLEAFAPVEWERYDLGDGHGQLEPKVMPWHYEMAKRLSCFLYQCAEDATYDTAMYKALEALKNRLHDFIVCYNREWQLLPWREENQVELTRLEKVAIRYSLSAFDPESTGMQVVSADKADSAVAKLRREGWTIRDVRPATQAEINNAAYRLTL